MATQFQPSLTSVSKKQLSTSMTLQEYFYTKKHEWVNVEGGKGKLSVFLNFKVSVGVKGGLRGPV